MTSLESNQESAREQLDLGPIEARAKAATPGPWVAERDVCPDDHGVSIIASLDADKISNPSRGIVAFAHKLATITDAEALAIAQFIAHSRTDIPALIAEVRSKDAALAKANERVKELMEALTNLVSAYDRASEGSELWALEEQFEAARTALHSPEVP